MYASCQKPSYLSDVLLKATKTLPCVEMHSSLFSFQSHDVEIHKLNWDRLDKIGDDTELFFFIAMLWKPPLEASNTLFLHACLSWVLIVAFLWKRQEVREGKNPVKKSSIDSQQSAIAVCHSLPLLRPHILWWSDSESQWVELWGISPPWQGDFSHEYRACVAQSPPMSV